MDISELINKFTSDPAAAKAAAELAGKLMQNAASSNQSGSASNLPDLENMTPEELEEYFSEFHFDFDEPIVLPDDE